MGDILLEELRANLVAGAVSARYRDFQDPVGWADLVYAQEDTASVAIARRAGHDGPGSVYKIALPKGVGEEFRQMSIMDPFDEIIYRTLVGRSADVMDASLSDSVSSYRLQGSSPAWSTRDYRYGIAARKTRLIDLLSADACSGMMTLDVQNYYPTMRVDTLSQVMLSVGAEVGDV